MYNLLSSLNILLAEDNAVNQKVAARLLEKMGHRVDVVGDGHAAVAAWQSGRYHLVRTRGEKGESWLFFKGKDEHARADGTVPWGEESVLTGRTVEEVAGARDRVWHSNRGEKETSARPSAKQKIARKAAAAPAAGAPDLSALIAQLPAALPRGIPLSNLEKVLYPEQGLTKGALVAYYAVVADLMLPHLAGRPLTIVRCPDGRHKHCFYQKHSKDGQPSAIHRVPIEEEGESGWLLVTVDGFPLGWGKRTGRIVKNHYPRGLRRH